MPVRKVNKGIRYPTPIMDRVIDAARELDGLDCHGVAARVGSPSARSISRILVRIAEEQWAPISYEHEQDGKLRIVRWLGEQPEPIVPWRSMGRPYPGGPE